MQAARGKQPPPDQQTHSPCTDPHHALCAEVRPPRPPFFVADLIDSRSVRVSPTYAESARMTSLGSPTRHYMKPGRFRALQKRRATGGDAPRVWESFERRRLNGKACDAIMDLSRCGKVNAAAASPLKAASIRDIGRRRAMTPTDRHLRAGCGLIRPGSVKAQNDRRGVQLVRPARAATRTDRWSNRARYPGVGSAGPIAGDRDAGGADPRGSWHSSAARVEAGKAGRPSIVCHRPAADPP
jgi:hypothetical protein